MCKFCGSVGDGPFGVDKIYPGTPQWPGYEFGAKDWEYLLREKKRLEDKNREMREYIHEFHATMARLKGYMK